MGLELFGLVEEVKVEHSSALTAVGLAALVVLVVIAVRTAFVAVSLWSLARRSRRSSALRERIEQMQDRLGSDGLRAPPRRPGADEAKSKKRMAARTNDFEAFLATDPVGHLDRIEPDVLEAILSHLAGRPLQGRIQVLRTAESVPERVAEFGQPIPGKRGGTRFIYDPAGRLAVGFQPSGLSPRRAGEGQTENTRQADNDPALVHK